MYDLISIISNLFKNYGTKSITMDDIAREIGMSKKTLYQHFKNKNDVILKVIQFEQKNECDELDMLCRMHSNAIDQLLAISKHIASKLIHLNPSISYDMNKYYHQIWEKLNIHRKGYIQRLIKQNFQIGMKQGIYQENLNIDIIAALYTFLLDIKGFEIYNNGINADFNKIFKTLFMYHIHGIANKEGIEYLEKQFNK